MSAYVRQQYNSSIASAYEHNKNVEGGRHETPAGPPTTCDAPCLMSRVHHASKYSPRGHSLGFALGELAAGPEVLGESPSRHVLVDQVPEAVLRRFFKSDRKEKKKKRNNGSRPGITLV